MIPRLLNGRLAPRFSPSGRGLRGQIHRLTLKNLSDKSSFCLGISARLLPEVFVEYADEFIDPENKADRAGYQYFEPERSDLADRPRDEGPRILVRRSSAYESAFYGKATLVERVAV